MNRSVYRDNSSSSQGKFLPFHRYFTWIYEQALREECGYDGVQPYWDWTNHPEDLSKSSLFDGGPYSMSGNGEAIPHGNYTVTIPFSNRTVTSFPGTGGGCVQTGPFANMTVHLGPTATFPRNLSNPHGFEDNPRCLVRDFRPFLTVVEFATQKLTNLILNSTDYLAFQQTVESTAGGVHGAGHRGVGGDMADLYSSPNDPVFYFHHAAIDRVWSLWQSLDPARKYQIAETDTFQNSKFSSPPPTPLPSPKKKFSPPETRNVLPITC